uniref:Uncharacterized protein n=2 Tax=Meloidogyne TaxID=189290 RepID=A0A914KI83_MELIC
MAISQIFPIDELNPENIQNIIKNQNNDQNKLNNVKTSFLAHLFSLRVAMLILTLICLTVLTSNSLLLNFTVICMKKDANFTSNERGVLIAGTAMGGIAAFGTLPPIIDIFGIRLVLSLCGIVSGIVTTALPELFLYGGFWAILIIRIIQGFCLMPAMPTISKVTHSWARDSEQAIFVTILSLFMQDWCRSNVSTFYLGDFTFSKVRLVIQTLSFCVGREKGLKKEAIRGLSVIITMPITGRLCNTSLSWPAAYYLFGILCLIVFILFFIIYRDWPHQSSLISQKEAKIISTNQQKKKLKDEKVPYIKMLTDRAVWACICVAISCGLSHWLFAQYGPLYMHEVLNYNVNSTGIWIAAPYFASIFSKVLVPLIEYFPKISLKFKIVWITFICQLINVLCYFVLGIWTSSSHLIAQIAIIVVLSANGAGFVGLAGNSHAIARQHAHFILSIVSLINYVITLIQPIIIAWIASSKDQEELANDWSKVFFAYGAISLVLDLLFFFGAGTKPRSWTEHNLSENKKENNKNVVYIDKL